MFVKIGDNQKLKVLEPKDVEVDPEEIQKKLAEVKQEIKDKDVN